MTGGQVGKSVRFGSIRKVCCLSCCSKRVKFKGDGTPFLVFLRLERIKSGVSPEAYE